MVVPAARRKGHTKKCDCPWVLNINAPPSLGIIHFTKYVAVHAGHKVWPANEGRARFIDGLTDEQKHIIHRLTLVGSRRTKIVKVSLLLALADR